MTANIPWILAILYQDSVLIISWCVVYTVIDAICSWWLFSFLFLITYDWWLSVFICLSYLQHLYENSPAFFTFFTSFQFHSFSNVLSLQSFILHKTKFLRPILKLVSIVYLTCQVGFFSQMMCLNPIDPLPNIFSVHTDCVCHFVDRVSYIYSASSLSFCMRIPAAHLRSEKIGFDFFNLIPFF